MIRMTSGHVGRQESERNWLYVSVESGKNVSSSVQSAV